MHDETGDDNGVTGAPPEQPPNTTTQEASRFDDAPETFGHEEAAREAGDTGNAPTTAQSDVSRRSRTSEVVDQVREALQGGEVSKEEALEVLLANLGLQQLAPGGTSGVKQLIQTQRSSSPDPGSDEALSYASLRLTPPASGFGDPNLTNAAEQVCRERQPDETSDDYRKRSNVAKRLVSGGMVPAGGNDGNKGIAKSEEQKPVPLTGGEYRRGAPGGRSQKDAPPHMFGGLTTRWGTRTAWGGGFSNRLTAGNDRQHSGNKIPVYSTSTPIKHEQDGSRHGNHEEGEEDDLHFTHGYLLEGKSTYPSPSKIGYQVSRERGRKEGYRQEPYNHGLKGAEEKKLQEPELGLQGEEAVVYPRTPVSGLRQDQFGRQCDVIDNAHETHQRQTMGSMRNRTPSAQPSSIQRNLTPAQGFEGVNDLFHKYRRESEERELKTYSSLQRQFNALDIPEDSPFLDEEKDRIIAIIEEYLGRERSLPRAIDDRSNPIKIPNPGKYNGERSMEKFDTFLYLFCSWARAKGLGGPNNEFYLVEIIGHYLQDKAQSWYIENVASINRRQVSWSLSEVMTGLYARFVFEAVSREPTDKYNVVRYTEEGGIQTLISELRTYAKRMPQKPSPIAFMQRILQELPPRMKLIDDSKTPEDGAEIQDIQRAGIKYENAQRLAKLYNQDSGSGSRTSSSRADNQDSWRPGYQRERDTGRLVKEDNPTVWKRDSDAPRNRTEKPSSTAATAGTSKRGGEEKNKPSGGSGGSRNKICHACGQVGHFAADKVCPKYGKGKSREQLRAIHETDESERDTSDADSNGGYGEEYQSESEGEYEHISDFESENELREPRDQLTRMAELDNEFESDYEFLRAMGTIEGESGAQRDKERNPRKAYKISSRTIDRPIRTWKEKHALIAEVQFNGKKAITMFDSGSSTDSLSPAFARVNEIKVHPLSTELALQLGTVGSRSSIKYGTIVNIDFGPLKNICDYVDVVNLDRYDAILGTVFMRKHKIMLDLANDQIFVDGKPYPALSETEERKLMARRSAMRKMAHPQSE
ncbi:hypothetical protein CC1G_00007 [Coprinopsis cinerea okayama7|uniref:CCHC-type domain-containing protein n=1 Tax=Coprinopsis cinerea (strain Okayama-7 / 130 / ATCC MYA-4618 / FGSC 9003) TaxID=240176 RepID=A8NWE1_COPC7|nr:hypothetical protein CC1G_00007 [Coprinopsis cinerea okayama7\|eukprot:XP_001836871.2 hypothetical protein CC1G_00007 [Coprinopsis cinerea okayama7\